MLSLRQRLWVLWGLALAASVAVGLLLTQLYRTSATAQADRADILVQQACSAIRDRYAFYVAGWDGADAGSRYGASLGPVLHAALAGQDGLAGGIWSRGSGDLALVNPPAPAPDGGMTVHPNALRRQIAAAASDAIDGEQTVLRRVQAGTVPVLVAACPLAGPLPALAAWTQLRPALNRGDRCLPALTILPSGPPGPSS